MSSYLLTTTLQCVIQYYVYIEFINALWVSGAEVLTFSVLINFIYGVTRYICKFGIRSSFIQYLFNSIKFQTEKQGFEYCPLFIVHTQPLSIEIVWLSNKP